MKRIIVLALACALTGCDFGLASVMPPMQPTPTPPSYSRTTQSLPAIKLYDGWPLDPFMFRADAGCYSGVPSTVYPKAPPIEITPTGLCNTVAISGSDENHLTNCYVTFANGRYTVHNGADAQCRIAVQKDGSLKFIYNLKKIYRPRR